MREIEFRGKNEYCSSWVIGYYYEKNGTVRIKNDYQDLEIATETLSQYTGLKDKNGTKIFEGDIVKVEFNTLDDNGYTLSTKIIIAEVYFDTNEYAYKVLQHLGRFDDGSEDYDSFNLYNCMDCEVIGNIYDNPELLEVEDD